MSQLQSTFSRHRRLHRRSPWARASAVVRRGRRPAEGMTLVEIMIVVIIMALIATGVAVAVLPALERSKITSTTTNIETVRSAVTMYVMENSGDCPGMSELTENDYISGQTSTEDAWGNAFSIECEGNAVYVISAGPDGEMNTEDDLPQATGN